MRNILFCVAIAVSLASFAQAQPTTAPAADEPLDQAALERQFKTTMTGAVLVGRFVSADRPDAAPKEDRYTIESARKIPFTDRWLLTARIQYGGKDVTVPLTIPVKWAGDTPVISVTDMAIPRLGTWTARVTIYRGQYAGTWSGRNHGGYMWGRIERADAQPTTKPATQPAQ